MVGVITAVDCRLLVVDPKGETYRRVCECVGTSSCTITRVLNGKEAVQALLAEPAHIVLVDFSPQDPTGFELLDFVHDRFPEIRVILITSVLSERLFFHAIRNRVYDCFPADFDPSLFRSKAEKALADIEREADAMGAEANLGKYIDQLTAINELVKKAASIYDTHELLQMVAEMIHSRFGYYHVFLALVEEESRSLAVAASAGHYGEKVPIGTRSSIDIGITGRVARTGEIVLVNRVDEAPDYFEMCSETRSELCLPIKVNGDVTGVLNIESTVPNVFRSEDVALLTTLTDHVSSALKNIRLFEDLSETKEFLETMFTSSGDGIVTTDTHGVITFFSPGAESIYGYSASEAVGQKAEKFFAAGLLEVRKMMDRLMREEKIVDYETVQVTKGDKKINVGLSVSLLKDKQGNTIGTLGIAKDITKKVKMEAALKEASIRDGLTGLYNYRYFLGRLSRECERARRQKHDLAMAMLDLDNFKGYNDQYGHPEGDKVLRAVGRLLEKSVRKNVDISFRYGGDEFVVVLPDCKPAQIEAVVRRIKNSVESGLPGGITVSVGVVRYDAGYSVESYIRVTDDTLYQAKKSGKSQVIIRP
jgi:diguanylate cyclase (GGDEF)-like protein/PAS domain S-box-containing protein